MIPLPTTSKKEKEKMMPDDKDSANPPELYEDWYDLWTREQVKTVNAFYGIE